MEAVRVYHPIALFLSPVLLKHYFFVCWDWLLSNTKLLNHRIVLQMEKAVYCISSAI